MIKFPSFKVINIGQRKVGDGQPCFIIAEIGSNHNHDFEMACRLIEAAAEAGADAVKFQTFRATELYSKKTPGFSYLDNQDTFDLIHSLELDRSWQVKLQAHAKSCNIDFFSSPFDTDAINSLSELDVPAYKVASFELTDDTLITEMASRNKPVILSTGMASWMDIQNAVDAVRTCDNDEIILLQCTSLYPAPINLSNLYSMSSMRHAFDILTGYSDHTEGDHISCAAVAIGACVIEKHFTLDRSLPGPDHPYAMEPAEFKQMIQRIRDIESAFGNGSKNGPRPEEQEMAEKGRRSLHAAVDINAGQIIKKEMLTIKRPGLGISPSLRNQVIGRTARKDIKTDEWISWEML